MNDQQTAFLLRYAELAATDVSKAMIETATSPFIFAEWVNEQPFIGALHHLFVSVEMAPDPDPEMLPPRPSLTINLAAMGINKPPICYDPYGPRHNGRPYDHTSRRFADVKASDLKPSDIEWFNTIISWKDVDKAVAAGGGQ